MDVYVNRYRRFETAQSYGYDFLIPDNNVWDKQIKQWINLFITEGTQRNISFLAPVGNDYGKKFISFGTIKPDTEGRYDRDGRLNYWADLALIESNPKPVFTFDVQAVLNSISAHLDECESTNVAIPRDAASFLSQKRSSPPLLKLHDNPAAADAFLRTIADYYLFKDKKLVVILEDDSNYDKYSTAVCKAIFENAPSTKSVFYISYTNDLNRLHNSGVFNLFCVPASERKNIPQDKAIHVIDLVAGNCTRPSSSSTLASIIKYGMTDDFNLFLSEHKNDPTIAALLKVNSAKSVSSLIYLYTNFRGFANLRPEPSTEAAIIKFISDLRKGVSK